MAAERSFTDDQITAIVAGLITALRPNRSSFGVDWETRAAMRHAADIMNLLRGKPTQDEVWRQETEQLLRQEAERMTELTRLLATGHIHSAFR